MADLPTGNGPGYQPSFGKKLFMFLLTLAALIGVWVYYFMERGNTQ